MGQSWGHHQWGLDEDESRDVGTFLLFDMHDKPKTSPFHCYLHLDRFGTSHRKEHYKWVCTTQEPFKVGICASEYTCTTDCHGEGASSNQVRARDVQSQPGNVAGVQTLPRVAPQWLSLSLPLAPPGKKPLAPADGGSVAICSWWHYAGTKAHKLAISHLLHPPTTTTNSSFWVRYFPP